MSAISAVVTKTGETRKLRSDEVMILAGQRDRMLEQFGHHQYTNECLPEDFATLFDPVYSNDKLLAFMVWEGAEPDPDDTEVQRKARERWEQSWFNHRDCCLQLTASAVELYDSHSPPQGVASGQLIAHLTYLAAGRLPKRDEQLIFPHKYGLQHVTSKQREIRNGRDIHEALASGEISLELAIGTGYGPCSLELRLRSNLGEDMDVSIQRGTVFQQNEWVHRSNLIVASDYVVSLPAGHVVWKKLETYLMNRDCALPSGNMMSLTEFVLDDAVAFESQGKIWDHFAKSLAKA
eukprot:TRINITY_DN14399_c0_g2_i1.p1 TRINITY_DN14399_c0_g2~~TRINITY_DN14399_c0_g2_i1.p1  ORF type:complete len:293 (+),score=23.17 TRINITY_DN14399_c0_g2_i1:127-1005(+)